MKSSELRSTTLCAARRIVIKLGTELTAPEATSPHIDQAYVTNIAHQIVQLRAQGFEITLVSSGAIGAGCAEMGLKKRPLDVADLQAIAAVGQRRLMTRLHNAFDKHQLKVAQLLLTRSDFDDRTRFLNIRNCVTHLHRLGCLPVINENDTVSVDELRFGDNDLLAALICNALRADALVLLTGVDGLLDKQGRVIDQITDVLSATSMVRENKSKHGSGGMMTKLHAARQVTDAGEVAVIANGRDKDVLLRLFEGEQLGTIFVPAGRKLDSRQRWIGLTKRPSGTITIDAGAATAVMTRGKSLLASGVTATTGRFGQGELVLVRDDRGREIARGLINYTADELHKIMGKRSRQFEKILGRKAYAEVIHRDNLVVARN